MSKLERKIASNVNKALLSRFGKGSWGPIVYVESFEITDSELEFRIVDEDSDEDDSRNVRESINEEIGEIIAEVLNKMHEDLFDEGLVSSWTTFDYRSFSDKGWYRFDI